MTKEDMEIRDFCLEQMSILKSVLKEMFVLQENCEKLQIKDISDQAQKKKVDDFYKLLIKTEISASDAAAFIREFYCTKYVN